MNIELYERELVGIDLVRLEESHHKKELHSLPLNNLWKVHKTLLLDPHPYLGWGYEFIRIPSRTHARNLRTRKSGFDKKVIPLYIFLALGAQKLVLNSIRNILCKLTWKGTKEGRKDIFNSGELYKPKNAGGLGLRDPQILSHILGWKIGGGGSNIIGMFGPRCADVNRLQEWKRNDILGGMETCKVP